MAHACDSTANGRNGMSPMCPDAVPTWGTWGLQSPRCRRTAFESRWIPAALCMPLRASCGLRSTWRVQQVGCAPVWRNRQNLALQHRIRRLFSVYIK
jgi:hypothetical protein